MSQSPLLCPPPLLIVPTPLTCLTSCTPCASNPTLFSFPRVSQLLRGFYPLTFLTQSTPYNASDPTAFSFPRGIQPLNDSYLLTFLTQSTRCSSSPMAFSFPRGIQPPSGSYWTSSSRASVSTVSSFGSASSVAEEAESRDLSAASNSSISAPDNGRKQPSKGSSKNGVKGKESPWIKQANSTPMDARLE